MSNTNSENALLIPIRYWRALLTAFMIMFVVFWPGYQGQAASPEEKADATPCNINATAEAQSVLQYLAALSSDNMGQAIVGQNCYHGNEITDAKPQNGYNAMVAELYNKTGKWAGIVGVDYEYMAIYSPEELSQANKVLINHWKKGGLVTVNLSPVNPWIIDESGSISTPVAWDGPGSPMDRSHAKLKELLDPSTPVSKVWRKKLDRIAAALAELQNAGVVVLWRPMQENNGNWFWWGNDSAGYVRVYRDMYDYFTNVKKLNNLLWVYSPYGAIPEYRTYPGDDFVDIIAPTYYNDQLDIQNYRVLSSMGKPRKPFAAAEYGPLLDGPLAKSGSLDAVNYIRRIKQDYPRVAYWVSWHSYPGQCWSIISCRNYDALMSDPDVITIDRLGWKQ